MIGDFAQQPRFQGAGSSLVNATRVENALDAMAEITEKSVTLTYAQGFAQSQTGRDPKLHTAAVAAAAAADVAVLFLGLPAGEESEGYDRTHIDLPADQIQLLEAVAEVNRRVVVVLANGGVVRVSPWERHAEAILEGWLAGQAGGAAIADLLFGRANPQAGLPKRSRCASRTRLPISIFPAHPTPSPTASASTSATAATTPKTCPSPTPSDTGRPTPRSPTRLSANVEGEGDDVRIRVSLNLTNAGTRTDKEVVQLYVGDPAAGLDRPVRELKAFEKVELAPGETRAVKFELRARDLSYFDDLEHRWVLEAGDFELGIGTSSRDLRLYATLAVAAPPLIRRLGLDSTS